MPPSRIAPMAICLALLAACTAQAAEPPTGLLCNLLSHPEKTVITDPKPDFCWIVPLLGKDGMQTAFQILVATSREKLLAQAGDAWDSGKVASPRSINVEYAGKPLSPHSSYWWAVRIWEGGDEGSAYSEPQRFNTGEFGAARRWPTESRWVAMAGGAGGQTWTLEDRHPIAYHANPPVKTVKKADGSIFLDFGRAVFSTLKLNLAWNPRAAGTTGGRIEIAVGEKNKGDTVDTKPGGGVIYRKYPLQIQAGTHDYTLEIPRFVPKYPHSQAMPAHMPEVIPFRYCEILPGNERITLREARQLALWYEFDDQAASFSSSSPALDQVYELCRYSLKVNTFNGDYAASERERMMYEADTYIQQMGHYAVDREFAIARYSAGNMFYHMTWPTEWISHAILMAWADYLHTGNTKLISRYYGELKPKTMTALAREDGLISSRTGLQTKAFLKTIHAAPLRDIVDWPTTEADHYEFKDYNTVVNAFHYRSLVLMARIAGALGNGEDTAYYQARAAKVYAAFNKEFFDKARGLYVDAIGSDHTSFHAQLFPLAFGLVPADHRKTVISFLKSKGMACSVYPANYLLEALYDNGEEQAALDLMTSTSDRSWLNMIRMGSTVTTEAWDMKYKNNIGWSHAWSSSPAHIIPRKLLGIEPLEPGFGKVGIHPRTGNLSYAKGKLPTIRGPIEVAVENEPSKPYRVGIILPANVTACVTLPSFGKNLPTVLLDGKPVEGRLEGNTVVIETVGSGKHLLLRER